MHGGLSEQDKAVTAEEAMEGKIKAMRSRARGNHHTEDVGGAVRCSIGHKLDSFLLNAVMVHWAMSECPLGKIAMALGFDLGPVVLSTPPAVTV